MTFHAKLAACLVAAVAGAAQAQDVPRDVGPFTEHVASVLRRYAGAQPVEVKAPLTLELGEIQANLDRLYRFCEVNAQACPSEIDRYAQAAAQLQRERNAPATRDAVRVVIRSSAYVQAANASVPGPGPVALTARPFLPGIVSLPVLDSPRAIKMLSPADTSKLGLTEHDAFALGLANLRRTLPPLMDVAQVVRSGQIGQLAGDAFHSSRLLLPDTWAPLANAQGGVLIAAVPATDLVLYIGEDTPQAIDALRALVRRVMARAPNRLSGDLMRWSDAGWQVLTP